MLAGQVKLKNFLLVVFAGCRAFAEGLTGWIMTRPEPGRRR